MTDGRSKRRRDRWLLRLWGRAILYLAVVAVCVVIVFPFFWMIVGSLTAEELTYRYPPTFFPLDPQFVSYVRIFIDEPLGKWIGNTLYVVLVVTACSVPLAMLGGYSLSRFRFAGRGLVTQLLLVTQMIPGTLVVIPIYLLFMRLRLLDTLPALILVDISLCIPIAILILKGFFDTIPVEVEEAAFMDGCNSLGVLSRIVFPLSLPGILTIVLLSFMVVWHEFLFAVTLARKEHARVLSVGIRFFIHQYYIDWNGIMAASVIATVPAVVVFLMLEKWFLSGLTGGALKG
jgi:multiple sugar transport system permease protein